ncbi:DUF5671 domain-containing protein [Tabrizicola sp.]|uniref:DUF5671 domain-containing protein n=1 Tax=Tabrizicola sp. TaxID=2005166 RepID=UPI003F393665
MKPSEQLAEFVGKALASGRKRDEISAALSTAGWHETEIERAQNAWSDSGFDPPVPRPRSTVSAQDAFIYGLLFTLLAAIIYKINDLGFSLIDLWFFEPEPDEPIPAYAFRWMRWSIALLLVVFPVFLWLNRRQTKLAIADPAQRRSALRKWFGYIMLFFAVLGLVGNLVTTLYRFLNGDLTLQFGLKALLVLVTLGLVITYYWRASENPESRNELPVFGLAGLAVVFISVGFWVVGSPAQGRLERRNAERMSDLSTLARCFDNFDAAQLAALPERLTEPLPCSGASKAAPLDPLTDEPYRFEYKSGRKFSVCASFEGDAVMSSTYREDNFNPQDGCLTVDPND